MKVNGEAVTLNQDFTVKEFLELRGVNLQYVAVERNGKIVPKAEFDKILLQEDDRLEIVSFVGGG